MLLSLSLFLILLFPAHFWSIVSTYWGHLHTAHRPPRSLYFSFASSPSSLLIHNKQNIESIKQMLSHQLCTPIAQHSIWVNTREVYKLWFVPHELFTRCASSNLLYSDSWLASASRPMTMISFEVNLAHGG